MEKKFVVELDIPEQMEKIVSLGKFGLSELLRPRIESALLALGRGKIKVKVYDYGGEPELSELFQVCPDCGHSWGKHFIYVNGPVKLEKPVPDYCEECPPDKRCHALGVIGKEKERIRPRPPE